MSNHNLKMTTARRRNNIYGEISDHIIMPFIAMGGDGVIYNTEEFIGEFTKDNDKFTKDNDKFTKDNNEFTKDNNEFTKDNVNASVNASVNTSVNAPVNTSGYITFYGRSATAMYVVKVLLRHGPYDPTPALTPAMIESLKSAALFLSATPLYAISHVYSQTTKYYTLSGAKVTLIR